MNSINVKTMVKYRLDCLVKFREEKWKGKDMMFVTEGYRAYSHDGISWSGVVSPSDGVYVCVGGKNGPAILNSKPKNGVSSLNNYCGLSTFLKYN